MLTADPKGLSVHGTKLELVQRASSKTKKKIHSVRMSGPQHHLAQGIICLSPLLTKRDKAPKIPFTKFVRGLADSFTAHIYIFAHILKAPPKSFFFNIKAIIAQSVDSCCAETVIKYPSASTNLLPVDLCLTRAQKCAVL